MEERLQVILLLLLLCPMDTFLCRLVLLGEGVSIDYMHVVNTIHTYLPEVAENQVSLLLQMI